MGDRVPEVSTVAFPILDTFVEPEMTQRITEGMFDAAMRYLNESSGKIRNVMLVVLPEAFDEARQVIFNIACNMVDGKKGQQ
jgi:hypothetical protein